VFPGVDPMLRGVGYARTEDMVIRYLGFEIGLRGMVPESIFKSYLGGIKSYFVENKVRNYFAAVTGSEYLRFIRRGYRKIHAITHPEGEAKKIAFTMEMCNHVGPALDRLGLYRDPLKREAILLAISLGIYYLLRKSEYLPTSKSRRGRKWKYVRFIDRNGNVISWQMVGKTEAVEMILYVEKSKTDQFGLGRLVRHKVMPGPHCIVRRMVAWAGKCRDVYGATPDDHIFQIRDHVLVNDVELATAMKRTVEYLGWDSSKVSAHSLRYGGATMLAAAGLPQYVIAYFGGWTADSKALHRYMQLGARAVEQASRIMAAGFHQTLTESRSRAVGMMQF
jgi:hypothetical protein